MENVEKKVFDTAVKEFARKMNASKDKTVTTAVGFDSKKLLKWLKKAPVSSETGTIWDIQQNCTIIKQTGLLFSSGLVMKMEIRPDENGEPVDPVNAGNIS